MAGVGEGVPHCLPLPEGAVELPRWDEVLLPAVVLELELPGWLFGWGTPPHGAVLHVEEEQAAG